MVRPFANFQSRWENASTTLQSSQLSEFSINLIITRSYHRFNLIHKLHFFYQKKQTSRCNKAYMASFLHIFERNRAHQPHLSSCNHEKCVHTSKSSKEKPIKLSYKCQERLRRNDYSFLSTYDTILIKKCLSSTFITPYTVNVEWWNYINYKTIDNLIEIVHGTDPAFNR